MSQKLMEMCVESRDMQRYIHHFAVKVQHAFPKLFDVEDVENTLWVAVFRAITERYHSKWLLVPFAMRAVFSQYGSLIAVRGNRARIMNELARRNVHERIPDKDNSYEKVEANFTLDQIAKDLQARANKSRQYKCALEALGLLRTGVTMEQCCKKLQISRKYGHRIFSELIQKTGEKYRETTITV